MWVCLWTCVLEFSQLVVASWMPSIHGTVVLKGGWGWWECPVVLTKRICKADKGVVHMTGLSGGKTLTSHWTAPPRPFPLYRVNNTQPRPSRPRAVLWWVGIDSKRARVKSDEMLSCVLPFCVCPSLHHVFAYDFPEPAVTHATSCRITPCLPLLFCLIWL